MELKHEQETNDLKDQADLKKKPDFLKMQNISPLDIKDSEIS